MATARYGYKLADGTKVPSVTTILKIKDPGALINWAYKTGRAHGNLEGRGEAAPANLYDGNDALAVGTCVHELCEVFVKGGDPTAHLNGVMKKAETLDKAAFHAQVVSAYSAFEFWCKGTQLEILECEVPRGLSRVSDSVGCVCEGIRGMQGLEDRRRIPSAALLKREWRLRAPFLSVAR